ncbi:MAG: tRNA pseudouridine(38-40) synthase TruA [Flavobacteriia bacterium]|nr:MAG: tRNA pseudouridine(38-40) synthase TruA [Flavobacteriia bacterium]
MRYFIELSYNGKNYFGWQRQPNAISIQEMIEKALRVLLKKEISVMGCGRTDTGVHAEQFFAHFDADTEFDKNDLLYRINSFLPEDIVVYGFYEVSNEAHARFDAVIRSYEYRIFLGKDPFLLDTVLQLHHQKLDVSLMNQAAAELLNYTDFKCFSKSKTDVRTYNCDVKEAYWERKGPLLIFHISADRFLRNMVRAIVGTLLNVGMGKTGPEEFKKIIESKERSNAGASVKAKGLFLTKVVYPFEIIKGID